MSIIQISRIQQRAGNLVDLPQLDNAQLGWATDARRLFIGRVSAPYVDENVEVITSYSNISFSQIVGSYGANVNFTNAENGQILGIETIGSDNYVVNKGGNAGGLVTLGTVSNVKITGGAIGYVLETDGTGNLNWTPKGYVIANIQALSNATPIIMTVANTTPFTNGTDVTITGVAGANANTIVNSQVFYVKVANDYPTSGNVELYTNAGLTIAAVGTNLTATPNTGTATFLISSSGGTAAAGGSQGSVQFNNSGVIDGSSNLVLSGANLDLVGTFTAGNIFANSGSISSGNLVITNRISAGGNITGGNLIGIFANGTSSIRIPTVNGNINMGAAGNTTVVVVTGTGANINGTLSATETATANYFIASNSLNGYFLANTGTTVGKIYENGNIIKLEANPANYGVALAANGRVQLSFDANGYGAVGASGGTTGYALRIAKNTTGATTAGSILINPTVQTDVTALASGVRVSLNTASNSAPYTITNLVGSGVYGGTYGANTTVTNQFGYYVDSTMTGATNDYAYYSGLAAATGVWNLYMNGTANNYMAGNLGIGVATPSAKLDIVTASSNTADVGLRVLSNASIGLEIIPAPYTGAYNPSVTANSATIVGRGATIGNSSLTLTAWSNTASSIKIGSDGNTTLTGNATVTGTTTLTGVATAPTAANGTNNTQIATTAFVIYNGVPSGCIMLWSGSIASIPSGWYLCNGTNGTPNLVDRFVIAAGSAYPVGTVGGNADAIVVSHAHAAFSSGQSASHVHGGTTNGMNRNNPHNHTGPLYVERGSSPVVADGGTQDPRQGTYRTDDTDINHEHTFTTSGVSNDHTHAITVSPNGSSGTNANMPPYYALAYIMKA
jgi:hypothetical protein